jgi:predicted nucleotidyltransferase
MSKTKPIPPKLFTVLTANPYTSKMYIFGSRAVFDDDQFSDIDLTVITDYPVVAEAYTRKILNDQFGIVATYTIAQNDNEVARSFFLSSVSLFHKIDIGFSLPDKTKLFPNSTLIFQNDHADQPAKESGKIWTESEEQHNYLDVLMGSLRYVKHRSRQEYWSAYKCYRGFIEQLAQSRIANQSSADRYKELDKRHNDEILGLFFSGDLHAKEQKYYEFVKKLIDEKQLLPKFSDGVLKVWKEYLDQ